MNPYEAVAWGCLGGVLPDALRLVTLRHGEVPQYLRQGFFWLSLLLLVAVAGLAAYLLSPQRVIDAIALGFSAPEILSSSLGSKMPRYVGRRRTKDRLVQADRGSVAAGRDIRDSKIRTKRSYSGDKLAEDRGDGLPKDDREAARLYRRAADQGSPLAQTNLGMLYAEGRGGLLKDDSEAARLYKLAADQGDATGQANLGFFYEQGRGGLPKDDREAARLYKLAADQGNHDVPQPSPESELTPGARFKPPLLAQLRHWWAN